MKIKELSKSERPRERLFACGPEALSNSELLAILLRSGTPSRSALDVAHSMVDDSLHALSVKSVQELCRIEGVGPGKACSIVAAFELGRRALSDEALDRGPRVDKASDVSSLMEGRLKGLEHEECWLVLMDSAHRLLPGSSIVRLSRGLSGATLFSAKEAVSLAINYGASSMILVHNHPGGDPHPSPADIKMTEQLANTASTCGIALLDHIVFADGKCYSFSDEEVF